MQVCYYTKFSEYLIKQKQSDKERLDAIDQLIEMTILKQLDAVIDNSYLYSLPESQDKRSIVVVKKIKATKHRYPRNYSLIATKPL